MMSRKLGGLEQSFLDYNMALNHHDVINITSSFAKINSKIDSIKLPNLFPWCIISKLYLYVLIFFYKPDVIITHGGRAINFAYFSKIFNISTPIVAISHGYGIKHILKCDYIIALDNSLKNHFIDYGFNKDRIFIAPNMIDIEEQKKTYVKKLPDNLYTIGALGRFEKQKGFAYLIDAIKIVKDQNYNVNLKIAGAGSLESALNQQILSLNLEKDVEFLGWIENKNILFNEIDIFCAPSIDEPFGIIALEAMSRKLPIIATNASGFRNIFDDGKDVIMVNTASSEEIAFAIISLIKAPILAETLGKNAYIKASSKYEKKTVSLLIANILCQIHKENGFKPSI